jgi:hypothetical protein
MVQASKNLLKFAKSNRKKSSKMLFGGHKQNKKGTTESC